jgi:4-amino-4-deoxy-L-arabinose transferase-like glycosyltransferase
LLSALAIVAFLGSLGSMEFWGKREQRAVAESLDTLDNHHWLVAEIQDRPRLEKPPLPRWTLALLMAATGRRDEWLLRLPSALSGLGLVVLTYALGRRIAGRSIGLASGFALTSTFFAIIEVRQAGNDVPLALFVTLALYAAWRRLHGETPDVPAGLPGDLPGQPFWAWVLGLAMGLGFLCKGPVVVPLVALTIVPYLAIRKRLKLGSRLLASPVGILLFVVLALCWPAPVLWNDPNAWDVWMLEIGQKTASAGVAYHHKRDLLATDWPGMAAPWSLFALVALVAPLLKNRREWPASVAFPWSWAVGNLAMFCTWSTAKPNYYLPCMPAVAILSGLGWVRVTRLARSGGFARRFLLWHWVVLFVIAAVAPVVVVQKWPAFQQTVWIASSMVLLGVVLSVWTWKRGADALALAPLSGAIAVLTLLIYHDVTPRLNAQNGYRAIASRIDRALPPEVHSVRFFRELDEGLWYYLPDRALQAVPEGQIRYNTGFALLEAKRRGVLVYDDQARVQDLGERLAHWMARPRSEPEYLVIRSKDFRQYAPQIAGLATPVDLPPQEQRPPGRSDLLLLKVDPRPRTSTLARQPNTGAEPSTHR